MNELSNNFTSSNMKNYRWLIIFSLCISAFAVILCNRSFWIGMLIDQQMILVGTFGSALVTNLYPSMLLSSVVLFGVLGNRLDKKTTLQTALLVYSFAIAIAFFLVTNIFIFAILLIVMGITAGAILSITLVYIMSILQEQKQPIVYIGYGVCIVLGTLIRDLTGFLDFHNKTIILTVVFILITSFIVNFRLLHNNKKEAGTKINLLSVILTITMFIFLTFTINEAPSYPFYKFVLLITLFLALIAFAFLILWEKQSQNPLYKNFHFSLSGLINGLVLVITFFVASSIPHNIAHYIMLSNDEAPLFVLTIVTLGIGMIISGYIIFYLSKRYTSKSLITIGLIVVGLVLINTFMWSEFIQRPLLYMLVCFILLGILTSFVGICMMIINKASTKDSNFMAVASNININREVGSILGFSFIGVLQKLIYNFKSVEIKEELPLYVQGIVEFSYEASIKSILEYSNNAQILIEKLKGNWINAFEMTMLTTGFVAIITAFIILIFYQKNFSKTNQ